MKMSKVDADFSVKTEGACFICYGREELRDLTTAYNNNGEEEIYSQIIHHCFNMQIAEVVGLSLLCSCCVEQLRAADTFRKQIQQAIDNFNSIKDFPENDDADEPYQESEGSDMDTSLQNIKLLLKKKNDKVEKAKKKNATILAQKSNIKEVFKEEKPKGEEGAKPKFGCQMEQRIPLHVKLEALTRVRAGESCSSTAREYGFSKTSMHKIMVGEHKLRDSGTGRRNIRVRRVVPEHVKLQIVQLYRRGMNKSDIAKKLGWSRACIIAIINKIGDSMDHNDDQNNSTDYTPDPEDRAINPQESHDIKILGKRLAADITLEEREQMKQMNEEGIKPADIAKHFNTHNFIVYRELGKTRRKKNKKLDDLDEVAVEIPKIDEIKTTVRRLATEITSEEREKMKRMYKEGIRPTDIAKHFNCNHHLIYRELGKLRKIETEIKPKDEIKDIGDEKLVRDCSVCGQNFPSHNSMLRHMSEHSPNFVCETCGAKFRRTSTLRIHMLKHAPGHYPCMLCDKAFRQPMYLRKHVEIKHEGLREIYSCPKCPTRFESYTRRAQHLAEVHNHARPRYPCKMCESIYATRLALNRHIRTFHYRERDHQCTMCEKTFFDKRYLKTHMLVHTGIRDFPCHICGKAFLKKFTLTEHIKIHTGEKRFICGGCGKAFTQKCSLKMHIKNYHEKAETQ